MTVTATAPAAKMSNGDAKPAATEASNKDAVLAQWLKAEAHEYDRLVAAAASSVAQSVDALVLIIREADAKKVYKTLGYRNLRLWIDEQIGDALKGWSKPNRAAITRALIDTNTVSNADAAKLTGVSEATASRDAGNAAAPKPSTATDRAVKALEGIAAKCSDRDKFPVADLRRLSKELQRTLALVNDELVKADGNRPRSAAEGTTGNGVNAAAAKPAAPKPAAK